jgi:bifunctional DNase/RNase
MIGRTRKPRPYFHPLPLALSLLSLVASACHAAAKTQETVRVEVQGVTIDPGLNLPVVFLQDVEKKKSIPIWIGVSEAQAIFLELQGTPPPRPLTHDLMKNILEQVGVQFEKVVVNELKGSTYYAHIHLSSAGKPLEVDSRPSDAIALALRFRRPIFVAKELFDTALPPGLEPASAKISGVTVQNLTKELATHFNLPETTGVLVADVGTASGEESLQRGDVIVAVAGETVRNVNDFRDKLNQEKGHAAALRILRDGKEVEVQLTPKEE